MRLIFELPAIRSYLSLNHIVLLWKKKLRKLMQHTIQDSVFVITVVDQLIISQGVYLSIGPFK